MAQLKDLIVTGNASFIGTSTAPTAASGTNNAQIATTAFVQSAVNGSKGVVHYGYCTTAAATQAKAVTISTVTALAEGLKITVRFQYAQTYNGVPTLNVNSLGAKNILIATGTNAFRYIWNAGETLDLVYDGTGWVIENAGVASTTYYGITKLSDSVTSASSATAATSAAVKAAYDAASQAAVASVLKYSVAQIPANADAILQNATNLMTSSSTGKPMFMSYLGTNMSQYTVPYVSLEFDDYQNPTEQYVIFKGFTFDHLVITIKIIYTYDVGTSTATYSSYTAVARDVSEEVANYGYCTTAAATQAKAVTISTVTKLTEGLKITVRFQYAQTYNGVPTLNVNSLGAKNILLRDGTNGARYMWDNGAVIEFVYNGTGWVMENGGFATTTYYGLTKLVTSYSSTSTASSLTPASLHNFATGTIAPYYSASSTYAVGDIVRYNQYLYRCNTAITTAEAWTAAHWTQIIAKDYLKDEIFIATYGTTTCAALEEAYQAGKTIICQDANGVQLYTTFRRVSATDFHFSGALVVPQGSLFRNQIVYANNNNNTWTTNTALMAPAASPALSGTPTAPTATAGTNTTQIATTAFVQTAIANAITDAIGGSY